MVGVLFALAAGMVAGCRGETGGHADFSGFNLILISLDTLRADRLGSYGYHRPTSPTIDELASRGVRFDRVVAESSWTLPSHMTLFTGLHPESHGVAIGELKLSPEVSTLSERLSARGYQTFGTTAGGFIGGMFGFERGFDIWRDGIKTLAIAIRQGLGWIDQRDSDRPYFLFLHTFDIHCPYNPPDEFVEAFRTRPARDHIRVKKHCGLKLNRRNLTPGQVSFLSDQYDAGIRAADTALKGLIDALDERDAWEDTILVVFSDHGEEFSEHGQIGHSRTVYIESLLVPLIIIAPGLDPRVVSRSAGLVDVLPTLAEMLDLDDTGMQGESLLSWMRGEGSGDPAPVRFSQIDRYVRLASVVDGNTHLILNRNDDSVRLFDLAADPREQQDIAAERPDEVAGLRKKIANHLASAAGPAAINGEEPTAEHEAQLRALGYIE